MNENNNNKSDLGKMLGSAISSVTGVMKDVKDEFNEKIKSYIEDMNLVKREELELMQQMLVESRLEQEKIKNRLDEIEKKLLKKE